MNLSCNPPAIRPSPKATFQPHVAPLHCRAAPSGDVSCPNCSPSVSYGTVGRHFMLLLFPERVVWNPRATFYTIIVPQGYCPTLSGYVSCQNCFPSVSCDTLTVAEDPSMNLSCNPPAIRPSPKATFQPHVAPQHCRAAPSGDISCFNCSPSIPCGTLGRRFMP